jgi:hypothetical protein
VGEMNSDGGGGGVCVFDAGFNLSNSELQMSGYSEHLGRTSRSQPREMEAIVG